jgi:hypothetical protein
LLLGVLLMVCGAALYFAGDLTRLQEVVAAKEGQTALRSVNDPEALDQVLKQYPSNRILKLVALANEDLAAIDAAAPKLLREGEPRDLSKPVDLGALGRSDLEALRRDLQAAQGSAAGLKPRYIALVKADRDRLESEARALNLGSDALSVFMAMIDEQQKDMLDLTSRMFAARAEHYSAYAQCVALLLREFGIYRVANGQLVFPFKSTADTYNRAAAAMAAAATRLAELDAEKTRLGQSQLDRWKAFVDQQVKRAG